MASTFRSTGTYTNLTRLELEQLRRADSTGSGKALTVGDSGLLPEGVAGLGNVNAEPFWTTPNVLLHQVPYLLPPTEPGALLGTVTQTWDIPSESAQWYGPDRTYDGTAGYATDASHWRDDTPGVNFTLSVQSGDLLLIRRTLLGSPGDNRWSVAQISGVAATILTVSSVAGYFIGGGGYPELSPDGEIYTYIVIRPNANQLFAVPGSGPLGREQAFMTVATGAPVHTIINPSIDNIDSDRVTDLIPYPYGTGDRADAIYKDYASNETLDHLGYRLILYPCKSDGTGPNLTAPIFNHNPIIDPAIPSTDQRMSIDYKAGIIRFSCAPATGGQIKPFAGCVNATTGRLQLYAVYWAIDTSMTERAAAQLWATRGTEDVARIPAKVYYDSSTNAWKMGSTLGVHDFFASAKVMDEEFPGVTKFGTHDPSSHITDERAFVYRQGQDTWKFSKTSTVSPDDTPWSVEMEIADKTALTVGDISAPPLAQADVNPTASLSFRGGRTTENSLRQSLYTAMGSGYGTLHLRRGLFSVHKPLVVPPGVTIEGEGPATKVFSTRLTSGLANATQPVFRFGPNTYWGVYDTQASDTYLDNTRVYPETFSFTPANPDQRIEGMDVVWNPVRRVWAIVYADVTSNAIWFNEVGVTGNQRFPGLGVDIKDSVDPLHTKDSSGVGIEHTPGHYPRIAHHRWTDEYSVVWVISASGSGGPNVQFQTFLVNVSVDLDETPTIIRKFVSPESLTGPNTYSDHPSVAVDNSSGGMSLTYAVAVSYWSYEDDLSLSKCSRASTNMGGSLVWSYDGGPNDAKAVISSTDVQEDGVGGFLTAWSRRDHALVLGIHGKLSTPDSSITSDLSDTGYPAGDFAANGIVGGSKFLYLGLARQSTWVWDSSAFIREILDISAYGVDGTVMSLPSTTTVRVKTPVLYPFGACTPWRITLGASGTGNGTATLTDATKDFSALGVQVGDVVHKTAEIGGGTYRGAVVTVVAPGGDVTKLSLDRNLSAGASPFNYAVYVGREFRWAIAPRSEIKIVRSYYGYGETSEVTVVGGKSATNYRIDQYEPDLVRLSRGEDKWLLVYQAFNTTAMLAGKSIRNFDDGYLAAYADTGEGFAVGDHEYPYREHVSTCSLLLNDAGTSSVPNYAELELTSQLPGRMSRDIEISHRSLGARDPITKKPNYFIVREPASGTPYSRMSQHMAREVSAINFMHRWVWNHGTGLIPDVTWSGSDWTVVSPSKAQIHSYTGTYIVTGGSTIFGDPTFYFGGGDVDAVAGTNFLRRTVAVGDSIYFPTIGLSAQITQIRSEHVVTLDSNPFGYGLGTTTNIEWVLVRDDVTSLGNVAAGIKNPGFRVAANGDVIISSHYTTFADPIPPELQSPNRSEIMRRVNEDSFQRGTSISDGWNIPGSRREDGIEPQSRYVGDVGFRGVAVGEPKTYSRRVLDEDPCCAISWGENLYGFVDRYKAETDNQVRFYRQSFGPYNNCIRNLAIEGATVQPSPSSSLSTLKVLTRNHVYTRHGRPTCSMGNFATDGYRNCFVYQDWRVAQGYQVAQDFVLRAVYTDAFGGNPVEIEGPRPQLDISATPFYRWPSWGGLNDAHIEAAANPFAPKVIWDGTRFVAAWVEGGGNYESVVCLGVFPGDENQGLQTSEMLDPLDILTEMQTAQAVKVDYRDQSAGSYHLTTLDIAYSGKVYAVLWASGLDMGTAANPGAALGVTLFDAVEFAGGLDSDLRLLDCSTGGAANGVTTGTTTFTAAGATLLTNGVRRYDILRIRDGAGSGTYRIITVVSETELTLDRVAPAAINQVWTVHRRLMPAAGRTYVIGVASGYANGTPEEPRDAYVNPHIIWDGKQFVAVWRGKQWDGPNQQDVRSLQKHLIPENGLGQAAQIIKMAAPDQWVTSTNGGATNLATLGIGFVEGNNANAVWIRLAGTAWGLWIRGRTPSAPIRPGDILVISSVFLHTAGSYTHDHDGWYRITEYNPTLDAVRIYSHVFDSVGYNDGEMVVFGAILSAGVGDQSQMYSRTDSFSGTGQNLQDAPGGFGANANLIVGNDWASPIESQNDPNAVYGFVYNEKWDEYALLYEGNNDLSLTKFKRGIAGSHVHALVSGTDIRAATIGWNGEHYLVVFATTTLNWRLYSRDLGLEDSGVIAPALASGGSSDIVGTEIWQQPGPICYGGYKAGADVQPQWRNLHVEWNPRLSRWVLSVSVLWYANETVPNSYQLNNRLWIPGLIDSWVGRVLHFTVAAAGYIAQYAQPGCKLLLMDAIGVQHIAIYTILDSDDAARTITVDTVAVSGVTPIDPLTAGFIYVLPREDVWCYTLGYDTPAIQFLDADGSSLENVILSGSPVDIEERYSNMARPIWQSGGPPVGAYYADSIASNPLFQGIQRGSQYNTRLLVPTLKVELPRFTNVRSRTKIKYGQGLTPGEPSTDRYTFGERNRRG
jgi:hypothetical protein